MPEEKRPVLTERLVVPIITVVGAFVIAAPIFFWASNLTTRLNVQDQTIAELKGRVQRGEDTSIGNSTRIAVVEANYTTVLASLVDIKRSLEKIETRFNLR